MYIIFQFIGIYLMCDGRVEGWIFEFVEGFREVFIILEDRKKQRSSGGYSVQVMQSVCKALVCLDYGIDMVWVGLGFKGRKGIVKVGDRWDGVRVLFFVGD